MVKIVKAGLSLLFVLLVTSSLTSAQTVIRMASYGSSITSLQQIADAFNDTHPDVKLEVELYPQNEYITKMTAMIIGGSAPDIFQTWAQYKSLWIKQGFLMDLSDRWRNSSAIQRLNIYPFMLESATSNGHVYGVPYDYNTELEFYDRDWFAQRGVAEPRENWTVEEHKQMARKLTDPQKGVYGEYNQIKRGRYESIQWMENWSGQGWLSRDGKKVTVNTPENIASVQHWYDLERQYQAAPFPGSFKPRGNLQGGGYAMWIGWISNAFTFANPPVYDWGMALFPKGAGGQKNFAQGHMFSIYAGSPKKEAAWQVIEWMASFEGQQTIIKAANRQPMAPNSRLWDMYFESLPADKSKYVKDWMYNVIYAKNYVNTFSYWDTYGQMETVMAKSMDNIFNKQLSLQNEMDEAARQLQVILNSTR